MPKDPKRVAAGKMAKRKGNKFEQEIAKSLCETSPLPTYSCFGWLPALEPSGHPVSAVVPLLH